MEPRVGIVILNYMNFKDTIECVDSALNLTYRNKEIIIVDNFSPNNSFEILKENYKNFKQIKLLRTNENLGFANGNNTGIKYFIEKKIKWILLVNNDTVFTQTNIIETMLISESNLKNIGAIGPKIIGSDNLEQNPIYAKTDMQRIIKDLIYNFLVLIRLNKFLKKVKRKLNANSKLEKRKKTEESYYLHGAAIMLTPIYLNKFEGLYPKTFLYYEENILDIIFGNSNMIFKFNNKAEIYHKEDQSSLASFNNNSVKKSKYALKSITQAIFLYNKSQIQLEKIINK